MIIDPYTWHTLPIATIDYLTPSTVSVCLPRPKGYAFRAGQYAIVRVRAGTAHVMRQYSFASAPQADMLELIVQREPGGVVSGWFHDTATIGSEIDISQPFGSFICENQLQPRVFIAGRAGIAPFLSMMRDYDSAETEIKPRLLYSARGLNDFCYSSFLKTANASFFDTENGDRLNADDLRPYMQPSTQFYVCGSKKFVDAIEAILSELGAPSVHIKRERFTLQ